MTKNAKIIVTIALMLGMSLAALDTDTAFSERIFLSTQIVDEARHHVFFDRFMREVAGLGSDTASTLASVQENLSWGFTQTFAELDRVTGARREIPGVGQRIDVRESDHDRTRQLAERRHVHRVQQTFGAPHRDNALRDVVGDGLLAGLAAAGRALEDPLEQLDCPGQGQAGRGAFGSRRSSVRKPCAAVTIAQWW